MKMYLRNYLLYLDHKFSELAFVVAGFLTFIIYLIDFIGFSKKAFAPYRDPFDDPLTIDSTGALFPWYELFTGSGWSDVGIGLGAGAFIYGFMCIVGFCIIHFAKKILGISTT